MIHQFTTVPALLAGVALTLGACGGGSGSSSANRSDNVTKNEVVDVVDNASSNNNASEQAPVVIDDNVQRWFPVALQDIDKGEGVNKGGKTIFSLEFDFNKDGLMDMLQIRNLGYKGLYLEAHINNGDRTFTHDRKYFAEIGNQWRAAWEGEFVDLNGDGRKDLIVAQSGCFDVYEDAEDAHCIPPMIQAADGTFHITTHPTLSQLTGGHLEPMDVDGDGDNDLLYQANVPSERSDGCCVGRWGIDRQQWFVYENLSDNGVLKFREHKDIFVVAPDGTGRYDQFGLFVSDVARIDINGDGLLDFMYSGSSWDMEAQDGRTATGTGDDSAGSFEVEVAVAINNGDFTFRQAGEEVWMGDAPRAIFPFYRVYVEDFDGDGDLDIFSANTGPDKPMPYGDYPGEPSMMLWNMGGKFFVDKGTELTWNNMGFTHQSDVHDIDNDGDLDLILGEQGNLPRDICGSESNLVGLIRVLLNDGKGKFSIGQEMCLGTYVTGAGGDDVNWWNDFQAGMEVMDLDGDGYGDIMSGDAGFAHDYVLYNDGNGEFDEWDRHFFDRTPFSADDIWTDPKYRIGYEVNR